MPQRRPSETPTFLNLTFTDNDANLISSSKTLRKVIGILGMLLPVLLVISLYLYSGHSRPLWSFSHYYFTQSVGIFVGVMCVLAIFLIVYKGKEPIDFIVSVLAGIAALLIVLFPTTNISDICNDVEKAYSVTILPKSKVRDNIHVIGAAIFFITLAFMSLFIFTKSDKPKEKRGAAKITRNRIYRVCGVLIILSLLVIFFGTIYPIIPRDIYHQYNLTFWMEVLAIESFGFSWLVKGETLFKDKA